MKVLKKLSIKQSQEIVVIMLQLLFCIRKIWIRKRSRAGYSIGIGYPPDWGEHTFSIRKNEKTLLEPNVTFHLMCGMWMDTWGLELSESVRVGYLLTNVPRDLHIVN